MHHRRARRTAPPQILQRMVKDDQMVRVTTWELSTERYHYRKFGHLLGCSLLGLGSYTIHRKYYYSRIDLIFIFLFSPAVQHVGPYNYNHYSIAGLGFFDIGLPWYSKWYMYVNFWWTHRDALKMKEEKRQHQNWIIQHTSNIYEHSSRTVSDLPVKRYIETNKYSKRVAPYLWKRKIKKTVSRKPITGEQAVVCDELRKLKEVGSIWGRLDSIIASIVDCEVNCTWRTVEYGTLHFLWSNSFPLIHRI